MALISSELAEYSRHKGRNRARYRFTFDNQVIEIGPVFVGDEVEANAKLSELEPQAIEQAKKRDAGRLSEIVDSGETSKVDVARMFLRQAMSEPEPYIAYRKLKRFNEFRISQGYTVAQVKNAMKITDKQWQKITARWRHFNQNAAAIEAYQNIVSDDPRRY